MAKANLTAARLRELLDYDPESGVFIWRVERRTGKNLALLVSHKGSVAGCLNTIGYWVVGVDSIRFLAHRLAWLHVHGKWPEGDIDHVNGIRSDNRLANLRDVTHKVNIQNQRKASKANQSGVMGAHWHVNRQRWKSAICANGINTHLGYFDTAEEAHAAYLAAKRKLHEGCTI